MLVATQAQEAGPVLKPRLDCKGCTLTPHPIRLPLDNTYGSPPSLLHAGGRRTSNIWAAPASKHASFPFKALRVKIPSTDVVFLPVESAERWRLTVSVCSPQENPVGERLSKYLLALQGVLGVVAKPCWVCEMGGASVPSCFCLYLPRGSGKNLMEVLSSLL